MPIHPRALSCAVAVVIALAATGSRSGAVGDFAPQPALPTTAGDERALSVMTYNIAALPWPLATGRTAAIDRIAARLAAMRRTGTQPRIVLLQEAFTPDALRIARRAGYHHIALGPDPAFRSDVVPTATDARFLAGARRDRGEGWSKLAGSGLMILSDHPIAAVHRMAFPAFACAGFDCLANKGVLIAQLRVPGVTGPVAVVNAHLNARRASGVPVARAHRAYQQQVELMTAFIGRHVRRDAPMLLGGDMNIGRDPARASAFFGGFARARLNFVTPQHGGLRLALAGPAGTAAVDHADLTAADRHGKDWLFARAAGGAPMPVSQARAPFGAEPDGMPLSDHVGYVVDYLAPAAAPSARHRITT